MRNQLPVLLISISLIAGLAAPKECEAKSSIGSALCSGFLGQLWNWLASGTCGGPQTNPPTASLNLPCTIPGMNAPASDPRCCNGSVPVSPLPPNCAGNSGLKATDATLMNGAAGVQAAGAQMNRLSQLLSSSSGSIACESTTGNCPVSSPANAQPAMATSPNGFDSAGQPSTTGNPASANSTGSSGMSPMGGLSSDVSTTPTQPAVSSQGSNAGQAVGAQNSITTGTPANAAKSLQTAGYGSGFLFGNGTLGGSQGEGDVGFGANVPSMKGSDPANYFDMIDVNDSIFKIVENRYRDTAMQWAISSAGGGLDAGGATVVHPRK